jgi:serine protease
VESAHITLTVVRVSLAGAFMALSLTPPLAAQVPRRVYPTMTHDRLLRFREAVDQALDHVPGEVIVRFRDGLGPADETRALEAISGLQADRDVRWIGPHLAVLRDRSPRGARDVAAELAAAPEVIYAEPNYLGRLQAAPNDPSFSRQWNLQQLRLPAAWDIAPGGNPAVIVAVIDSGVTAVAAQTLSARTWDGTAIVEIPVPVAPSPDFDLARFVDPADFTISEASPSSFVFDSDGHGTHTGSTVGEGTNNGVALAGIAYRATIMPLKACFTYWDFQFAWSAAGESGFYPVVPAQCPTSTTAAAIRYAADHGADVINLSLGGYPDSITLFDALTYARDRGVFIAIANGNSFDSGNEPSYPAVYASRLAGVMSVAGLTRTNTHAWYSTTNADTEIAAYGGDLQITNADGIWQLTVRLADMDPETVIFPRFDRYEERSLQGTSMASPHVAGVAALLHSRGITDAAAKEAWIAATALDVGPRGRDDQTGAGLVQPRTALLGVGIRR